MRKGNQVKIEGKHPYCGRNGIVNYSWGRMYRQLTREEVQAWYDSPDSKGINCAGETKLPPQSIVMHLHKDRLYTVLRARARVRLGWGNAKGGYTKVLCTVTGEEVYVKRDLLEVVPNIV